MARGGNVHAVTRHGVTPLWHAAAGGHMAAVSVLLDVGASPAVQVSVYVCITVIVDHGTHFLPSVRARDGANTHWRWRSRLSSTSFKFRTVLRSLSFFTCLRVMFLTRAYAVRHSSLKGEPLVRETASKTDETILSWPQNFFSSLVFDTRRYSAASAWQISAHTRKMAVDSCRECSEKRKRRLRNGDAGGAGLAWGDGGGGGGACGASPRASAAAALRGGGVRVSVRASCCSRHNATRHRLLCVESCRR